MLFRKWTKCLEVCNGGLCNSERTNYTMRCVDMKLDKWYKEVDKRTDCLEHYNDVELAQQVNFGRKLWWIREEETA